MLCLRGCKQSAKCSLASSRAATPSPTRPRPRSTGNFRLPRGEAGQPSMRIVVSVICYLGLVLLANGLCFGKQQNLLPLPHHPPSPFPVLPLAACSIKVNTCHAAAVAAAVATRAFHCSRNATSLTSDTSQGRFSGGRGTHGEGVLDEKRALNKAYQISLFVSTRPRRFLPSFLPSFPPVVACLKFNFNFQFNFAF